MNAIVQSGATSAGASLVPQTMEQAIRLAQMMSSARMVPKHLQGDVGTCFMVVEQSMRWRMSPFAVAQCTSNIGGKLNYEGKLVAAAVECSGAIVGGFDYKFAGQGDDRTITVSAMRVGEAAARSMDVRLGDVKTTNEWWKKQPDQQLVYSGTRNWARRWAPSVMLGVYSPEEFNRDGRPGDNFDGATLDAVAEPSRPTDAGAPIGDNIPMHEMLSPADKWPGIFSEPNGDKWLINVDVALREAPTLADVTEIAELAPVTAALSKAPPAVKAALIKAISEATERVTVAA